MAISDDLFQAILAMDSYNRGYDPGLAVTGSQIGYAFLGLSKGNQEAKDASFFAEAYNWARRDGYFISRGRTILFWSRFTVGSSAAAAIRSIKPKWRQNFIRRLFKAMTSR